MSPLKPSFPVGLAVVAWALSLGTSALASTTLVGDYLDITYESDGLWGLYDTNESGIILTDTRGYTTDVTGYSWVRFNVDYTRGIRERTYATNTAEGDTFNSTTVQDLSTSTTMWAQVTHTTDDLTVVRNEIWDVAGNHISQHIVLTNTTAATLTDIQVLFSFDNNSGDKYPHYKTEEWLDTDDVDGDGIDDYVRSSGYYASVTLAASACDPANTDLGHDLDFDNTAETTLVDVDMEVMEGAATWRTEVASLGPYESTVVSVILIVDATSAAALVTAAAGLVDCDLCDVDLDGVPSEVCGGNDCDDTDATILPGTAELCDLLDNDCNGDIDEADAGLDSALLTDWYPDTDSDGFGAPVAPQALCFAPTSHVDNNLDCDDARSDVSPDGTEVCDDLDADENCNGTTEDDDPDLDTSTQNVWYLDEDGDGYGASEPTAITCGDLPGAVKNSLDCDDGDASVNPEGVEIPDDEVDQDCDGEDTTTGGSGGSGDDGGSGEGSDEGSGSGSDPGGSSGGGQSATIGATNDSGGDKEGCATGGTFAAGVLGWLGLLVGLGRRRRIDGTVHG